MAEERQHTTGRGPRPQGARPGGGRPGPRRRSGERPQRSASTGFRKQRGLSASQPAVRPFPARAAREGNAAQSSDRMEAVMQGFIEKLVRARGEERLRVAREMATYGRNAISAVDRLLNSRDRYLRLAAAQVLSHVDSPQAIPGLAHALQDEDPAVRLQAAAGLGSHKRPAARAALWYAFPDKAPGISIAILRSLDKMMTTEMEAALRVMDRSKLAPRVQAELEQILTRRARLQRPAPAADGKAAERALEAPLASAPWLRMLPGDSCVGTVVPGTEDIAAAWLEWQFSEVKVTAKEPGEVHFRLSRAQLPGLVQARVLTSVAVGLARTPDTDLAADETLLAPLFAYCHAKGLQSLIAHGDLSGSAERAVGKRLGLRSARPPGNPRTLRLNVLPDRVLVELLAPTDYPAVRNTMEGNAQSRALAACLCALTVSGPHDVFLDPFCGDGSVLAERALLGPVQQALGCDFSAAQLDQARQTWRVLAPLAVAGRSAAQFALWQGDRLPLDRATVDAVATILDAVRVAMLTTGHMRELARVLRPGQRAAFLTPQAEKLQALLAGSGLQVEKTMAVGAPPIGTLVVAERLP